VNPHFDLLPARWSILESNLSHIDVQSQSSAGSAQAPGPPAGRHD
jgi:hypothetical protein